MKAYDPKVSVIIVNWNGKENLKTCLVSLLWQSFKNFEIILLDKASNDGSIKFVEEFYPWVRLIRSDTNLDFAPSSRHNIFGLYYIGFWGSIPFSFLLGTLVGSLGNGLYYKFRANLESMIIYILLAMPCLAFESDPVYAVFSYSSILFIFVPIYVLSYILAEVLVKNGKIDKIKVAQDGINLSK
jgi:hypothetical protein